MQWKLMRDQFSGFSMEVADVTRRIQELADALTSHKSEQQTAMEVLRGELFFVVEAM